MRARHLAPRVLLLTTLWVSGGCGACNGEDSSIAKLRQTSGTVTRDHAASPRDWQGATVGDSFEVGDAVRTAQRANATVEFKGGGQLSLEANTIVRFLLAAPGTSEQRLAVELGNAEIRAGDGGIRIGDAVLLAGGSLRVEAGEDGAVYELLIGSARFEREGEVRELAIGEALELDIQGAIIEETEVVDAGAPAADAAVDAAEDGALDAEVDAGPPPGSINVVATGRGVTAQIDGEWAPIEGTVDLAPTTRVRVPARATIEVSRGDERATVLGAAEATIGPEGGALVEVARGRTTADATSTDVSIRVPGGTLVIRAGAGEGSRAEATIGPRSTEVVSRRGTVVVQGTSGREVLGAGETGVLVRDGSIAVQGRAPARADFLITAGESPTIHDPAPPTAVGVRFSSLCPGGRGVVEVARRGSFDVLAFQSFGEGSANFSAPAGTHRYRVRCATGDTPSEEIKAEGSVRVQRDTGRAQLPRRASRNIVDTDGRAYTLLYQNLLPIVTVRWPRAPRATRYELHVAPERGEERTFPDARAQHTFESGEIAEGTARVFFTAPGASPDRSPVTTIRLGFDNAAPTAYLQEPEPTAVITGPTTTVAGIALEGWSVAVGGTELPLDAQYRFRAEVPVPTDVDGIAIRISNARRGTHYYLRRVRGGAR